MARPSVQRLHQLFTYDPLTGDLRRGGRLAGCVVTGRHLRRYRRVGIDGESYVVSHVIWAVATGQWPEDEIDHRDGDSLNDKFDNLRPASRRQNAANRLFRKNLTGFQGVTRNGNQFVAQCGGQRWGRFRTPEEAHERYRQAAIERYGEFAGVCR